MSAVIVAHNEQSCVCAARATGDLRFASGSCSRDVGVDIDVVSLHR